MNAVLESDDKSKLKKGFVDDLGLSQTVRSAYGKQLSDYGKQLNKFKKSGEDATASIDGFNNALVDNGEQAVKTTTFLQDVGNGIKSVSKTAMSMVGNSVLDMVIGTGLSLAVKGISDFIRRDEIAIEKGQEAQDTISNAYNTFSSGKSTITSLGQSFASSTEQISTTGDAIQSVAERYSELSRGVNSRTNANMGLSDEDYQSYLNLSNQLAQLYPQLQASTDAQGNAMLNLGTSVSETTDKIKDLYNAQMLSANVNIGQELQTQFTGASKQIAKYQKQIDQYDKEAANAEKKRAGVQDFDFSDIFTKSYIEFDSRKLGENYNDYRNSVIKAMKEVGINNVEPGGGDYIDPETGEWYQKSFLHIMSATEEQREALKATLSTTSTELADEFSVAMAEAEKQSASTSMLIQDQWKGMTDSIGKYLQTTESFNELDTGIQNALISNLGNIDIESLSGKYDGDVMRMMYDQFITPLSELKPAQQEALSDVLDIDQAEMTTTGYYNAVHDAMEKAFPNDKEMQKKWMENFGLQDTINDNALELGKLKLQFKGYENELNALTGEDRKIAYDLIVNDEFSGTYEELKSKIAETKADMEDASTLTNLQSAVSKAQTSFQEIGTAVTESMSDTGLTSDSISAVKEQVSGLIDGYDELSQYDLNSLFVNTAKGVKLDNDQLENLLEMQHEIQSADFSTAINDQNEKIRQQKDGKDN